MFAKEREARIAAETQLVEERRRSDETQQVLLAAVTDLTSKMPNWWNGTLATAQLTDSRPAGVSATTLPPARSAHSTTQGTS